MAKTAKKMFWQRRWSSLPWLYKAQSHSLLPSNPRKKKKKLYKRTNAPTTKK